MGKTVEETAKKNNARDLEEKLINKSIKILEKKRISRTEARIISDTIQLIQFAHGLNCHRSDFVDCEQ